MMAIFVTKSKKPGSTFRACKSSQEKIGYLPALGVKAANFDSNGL